MGFYDEMSEMALDLLTEYGADAVIQRKSPATATTAADSTAITNPNATTSTPAPWEVPETATVEYFCKAVVSNYNEALLNGGSIKQGDKRIIVAAANLSIEPAVTDVIVCNGIAYNIVNVKIVSPAGTPIIYDIQARL